MRRQPPGRKVENTEHSIIISVHKRII